MKTMAKRECGTCSLCCKLPGVRELNKPIDTWCQHCKPGKGGCSIYASRPAECMNFECGWLANEDIGNEWFPARSKMILSNRATEDGVLVTVDPAYPNAWRREPYYSQLKEWLQWCPIIEIRVGLRYINFETEREVTRTQAWIEGRPEDGTGTPPV